MPGLYKNRYLVQREIGRGGMGIVYLAQDQDLAGKAVVIKELLDQVSSDPWFERRFRLEMEALARIRDPGVVNVLDFGQSPEGRLFLVMEFIEGVTLRSLMRDDGLPPARVANLVRQIGQALGAAHATGVIHRDLKPENVMVQRAGSNSEHLKIIDFGIATVWDTQNQDPSRASRVAGSLSYMAPEQVQGSVSRETDVYSFGVVAHELLTGRRPFDPNNPDGPNISADLPEPVRQVLGKATSFLAKDRYSRAEEFGELLAAALTNSGGTHQMGYVLFVDAPGFQDLDQSRQNRVLNEMKEAIVSTAVYQRTKVAGRLVPLSTGDGLALVFFENPMAPVECAVELWQKLRPQATPFRMGIHAGFLRRIQDPGGNPNVAGAAVGISKRVAGYGDSGHILVSRTVAEMMFDMGGWEEVLNELGTPEGEESQPLHLFNLKTPQAGRASLPARFVRRTTEPLPEPLAELIPESPPVPVEEPAPEPERTDPPAPEVHTTIAERLPLAEPAKPVVAAGWEEGDSTPSTAKVWWKRRRTWMVTGTAAGLILLAALSRPTETGAGKEKKAPPAPEARIAEFYSKDKAVEPGKSATICYSVENAVGVRIEPFIGYFSPGANQCTTVTPTTNTAYVLFARNSEGREVSKRLTLRVAGAAPAPVPGPPAKIVSFTASQRTVALGKEVSLCYEVTGAASVRLGTQIRESEAAAKGCFAVSPNMNSYYTLFATGKDGKVVSKVVSITVTSEPATRGVKRKKTSFDRFFR